MPRFAKGVAFNGTRGANQVHKQSSPMEVQFYGLEKGHRLYLIKGEPKKIAQRFCDLFNARGRLRPCGKDWVLALFN